MPSALATIRQLDATATPALPLVENPELAELQVPPYWGEGCFTSETETNISGAAGLLAAAWCLTGGRHQHRGCHALLVAGGMTAAAARRLLDQARISLGEPSHGAVVEVLRARLEAGVATSWG